MILNRSSKSPTIFTIYSGDSINAENAEKALSIHFFPDSSLSHVITDKNRLLTFSEIYEPSKDDDK